MGSRHADGRGEIIDVYRVCRDSERVCYSVPLDDREMWDVGGEKA